MDLFAPKREQELPNAENKIGLAGVAQWTECWPATKGSLARFQSGHMPGLQARSTVGGM